MWITTSFKGDLVLKFASNRKNRGMDSSASEGSGHLTLGLLDHPFLLSDLLIDHILFLEIVFYFNSGLSDLIFCFGDVFMQLIILSLKPGQIFFQLF